MLTTRLLSAVMFENVDCPKTVACYWSCWLTRAPHQSSDAIIQKDLHGLYTEEKKIHDISFGYVDVTDDEKMRLLFVYWIDRDICINLNDKLQWTLHIHHITLLAANSSHSHSHRTNSYSLSLFVLFQFHRAHIHIDCCKVVRVFSSVHSAKNASVQFRLVRVWIA